MILKVFYILLFLGVGKFGFGAPPQIGVRWGGGRSYETGFQSFEWIDATHFENINYLLDTHLIRIEPGQFAGNVGLCCRMLFHTNGLFGLNVFYDWRRDLKQYFQQIGCGIEYFTRLVDLRLNGYLPIGSKSSFRRRQTYDYGEGYLIEIEEWRTALWGVDLEIGKSFRVRNFPFFAAIGPYFYESFRKRCCEEAFLGGMGRIQTSLYKRLKLEFFYTYDRLFKSNPQLQLTFAIPTPGKNSNSTYRVERNPIILLTSSCTYKENY